jgi:hypothetical protein
MIQKYRAFIIKRIHLSKPSIKHTSTKAIITLFSFNITQNYFFYRKFSRLNKYTNDIILNRSKDLLKEKIEDIISKYKKAKEAKKEEKKEQGHPADSGFGPCFAGVASQGVEAKPSLYLRSNVSQDEALHYFVSAGNDNAINPPRLASDRIAIFTAYTSKHGSNCFASQASVPVPAFGPASLEPVRAAANLCEARKLPDANLRRSKINVLLSVQKKELILFKYKLLNQLVKIFNFYLKIYFYLIKMKKYTKIKRLYYNKLTLKYRRYQYRYYIYKYKFEKTKFLPILTKLLNKFINKKIEYNIINLKSIVYSPDIFTKAISLKLKKKKIRLHKYIGYVLGNVRITQDNNVVERRPFLKGYDNNSFVNKYKNLGLINVLNEDKGGFLKNIRALRSKQYLILLAQASNVGNSSAALRSRGLTSKSKATQWRKLITLLRQNGSHSMLQKSVSKESNIGTLNYDKISELIFKKIKYKKLGGIRILVKGRLTKRYRADRSVYRLKYTGGLKNIDASYKGISDKMYRGYMHSNIIHGFSAGKRRIGQYGVSGWISAKNYSTSARSN